MKRTTTINLAGMVYHIEEEAFQILKQYVTDIKKVFSKQEGVEEMIADIELRIGELFQERLSKSKEVITENDVKEVMTIMGSPHQFDEDYEPEQDSDFYYNSTENKNKKQLFRDTEEGMLAGVSAGLGHYFNIDPVIIRVLWIILVIMGGSGVLVYIIAWIAIPEAKTTAQKLKMYGQSANLDNFKAFADSVTKEAKTGFKRASNSVKNTFKKKDNTFTKLVRVIAKVFGFIMFFAGLMGTVALVLIFLTDLSFLFFQKEFLNTNLDGILSLFFVDSILAIWLIFTIVLIPTLFLIIAGGMLLFNQKPKSRGFILTLLIIWFIALVGLSFLGVKTGLDFKERYQKEEQLIIEDSIQRLTINLLDNDNLINKMNDYDYDSHFSVQNNRVTMRHTPIHVHPTEDSLYRVIIKKKSNGATIKEAKQRTEKIIYKFERDGKVLNLQSHFSFANDQKIRGQQIHVHIYVPIGKQLQLNDNLDEYPITIQSKSKFPSDLLEQATIWQATEEGMKVLKTL
ncbi:hypothetical protein CW751_12455 [Brumimicrobium salinarum]|uniref:Uncharacterized protein n=1 Tax=Brumimicrobium salinarum TaxID=2058658 RepID=A0A2I0R0H6_9FLAO|nr:PspC domain-containing protein [Brumimicrobium salinarum]PKR79890.1 hypothetical protein CW751_12455 [Brumimicrobium salinarum]